MELICKYYWVWPKKVKNDPKFVRDSNSSLKLLTFQFSYVRELETIKYGFDTLLCYAELDVDDQTVKVHQKLSLLQLSLP